MKKSARKILCLCLCAIFALSATAFTAVALRAEPEQQEAAPVLAAPSAQPAQDAPLTKDETVYVLAGADGSVEKIIVSDWIKNTLGASTLRDESELTDVENVKGEESCTLGGDGSRVWDAQGNDIYYQGNIEKELPVDLSVTYKLDGTAISPEELAGKSGRVTIRFTYTNRQYETVEIDGKAEKIYVPFAMLTGLLLDNDVFTNVEVSNGKLINDGDRTAVIGLAFPGLQENLAISKETLDIPDYVEISADGENIELGMTVTLAANGLFNRLDLDGFDAASDLGGSMEALTDAMGQLLDGSSQLYDGLSTLLERSGELVSGIDALAAGAEALRDGAGALDDGVSSLQSGAAQLAGGLNTLTANNDSLNVAARQVFETLLSTAYSQLTAAGLDLPELTVENYAEVLNRVIASIDENAAYEQALAVVTDAVETHREAIVAQVTDAVAQNVREQVTAAVREQVAAQVTQAVRSSVAEQVISSGLHMGKAAYDDAVAAGQIDGQTQAAIDAAIEQQMQTKAVQDTIAAQVERAMQGQAATIAAQSEVQMQSDAVRQTIEEQTELQIQKAVSENMASEEVQTQLRAAAEGAKSVIELKASLDSYNAFYLGLQSYTAGVTEAAAGAGSLETGAAELKAGSSQLYAGASELYEGILTLKNGTPTLVDGITQLRDGAMQLSDGLQAFNSQGIEQLVSLFDGDLDGLFARLRAMRDVSLHYKNFAGATEEMDGSVKFIYRTDSIG